MPKTYENVRYRRISHDCYKARRKIRIFKIIYLILSLVLFISFTLLLLSKTETTEQAESSQTIEKVELVLVTPEVICIELEEASEPPNYLLYDIDLSADLQNYTQDICKKSGVDHRLAFAMMQVESNFTPDAVSPTNDYGIMQINKVNHEWLEEILGITDWLDPKQNIEASVFILSQFNYYGDDLNKILMSYNNGPTGARRLWDEGVFETEYSRKVISAVDRLEVMTNE